MEINGASCELRCFSAWIRQAKYPVFYKGILKKIYSDFQGVILI